MGSTPFVGMTPPRPAPVGRTYGIPAVVIPFVAIPPLMPRAPVVWKSRPRRKALPAPTFRGVPARVQTPAGR